jgi:hypothetical protein
MKRLFLLPHPMMVKKKWGKDVSVPLAVYIDVSSLPFGLTD